MFFDVLTVSCRWPTFVEWLVFYWKARVRGRHRGLPSYHESQTLQLLMPSYDRGYRHPADDLQPGYNVS